MKKLLSAIALLLLLVQGAEAQNIKNCVAIKEGARRLACFDAAMKEEANKPAPPTVPVAEKAPGPEVLIALEIKGFQIGADEKEVRSRYRDQSDCKEEYCAGGWKDEGDKWARFAGGQMGYVYAAFVDKRLVKINFDIKFEYHSVALAALKEKYGKPALTESEFKTKGGLTTTAIKATWTQGDVELNLDAPSGSINLMRISLSSKAFLEKEYQERVKKASRNL